ncbi:glycosyltransferase [Bacillus toyonensis]
MLLIIGDGELENDIKNKVNQLGLENSVKFLGARDDVDKILQAIDVFLFPSHYEGLGISLIEAQSAGLRCIASDVITSEVKITNLVEFVSLNESAEYWAEKVLQYSNGYERENMFNDIQNANYDIKSATKKLMKMYEGMIGGKSCVKQRKSNKLIPIMLYLGYFIIAWWILWQTESVDYSEWTLYIIVLAFSTLSVQILIARYAQIKIISFSGMFIIFSYVFHFAHMFLLFIDYSFIDLSYGVGLYNYGEDVFREVMNFSLLSMLALFLGMMFAPRTDTEIIQEVNNSKKDINNHLKYYGKLGIILLIISLPIDLYLLLNQIKQMGAGGYASVHEFGVNLGLKYLSYLVNPAFFFTYGC